MHKIRNFRGIVRIIMENGCLSSKKMVILTIERVVNFVCSLWEYTKESPHKKIAFIRRRLIIWKRKIFT